MQVRLLPGPIHVGGRERSLASVDISRRRREKAGPARRRTLSREKLKALEELQQVDLKIRDLSMEAEKHPARLRQIEAERNQVKTHLDTTRGRLADNERARRQNEQLLQLEKDKVRKWESRLNELKTPREYAALARELDIAKKTNQTADEEIKRMAVLEAERKRLVELCDRSLVSKYERIRKQRGGVAVVPVVAGTCKGCQRNIPPQMANNLLTGPRPFRWQIGNNALPVKYVTPPTEMASGRSKDCSPSK